MNDTPERAQRESIILRVLWMLVFLVVWQLPRKCRSTCRWWRACMPSCSKGAR